MQSESQATRKLIRFESKNDAIMAANRSGTICRPIEIEDGIPTAWGLTDAANMEVPKPGGSRWDAYIARFFRDGDLKGMSA